MRNTKKILRTAIFNALNNVISVPVFDEKRSSTSQANVYVLLSTQQEINDSTHDTFITLSKIDVEVCQRSGSEVSKNTIDDVEEEITNLLWATANTDGLTDPSLIQIQDFKKESSISRALEISPTESILRNIITFSALIVQQS